MRVADTPAERDALGKRHQAAHADVDHRGCGPVLDQFEEAVRHSSAALTRPWGTAQALLSSDDVLYATFHQLVTAEARQPEDNEFDRARPGVDATLFPHYHEQIRFAALSLDGRGAGSYGGCSIVLKESIIAHRTTVFEENSLVFCRRHRVVAGGPLPPGYRAVWDERARLAAAKLYKEIDDQTGPDDFPKLLLKQAGKTGQDDFIEGV